MTFYQSHLVFVDGESWELAASSEPLQFRPVRTYSSQTTKRIKKKKKKRKKLFFEKAGREFTGLLSHHNICI